MKPLLLAISACVITSGLGAQKYKVDMERLGRDSAYQKELLNKFQNQLSKNLVGKKLVLPETDLATSKKPGVHRLAQDGMPCLVPDTKNIAAIPNAFKGKVSVPYVANEPRIPNPALPQQKGYYKISPVK